MTTPLYKQIYSYLLEKIIEGTYKRGDRVPSEKELSTKFNVSRITSKKALDLLADHEVIERIRGKGSFVLNDQPAKVMNQPTHNHLYKTDTLSIGLVLPDFSSNFGLSFVKHVEKICSELNIHLILKRSYGSVDEEVNSIHSIIELGVDGLLIIPVHGQHYNHTLLQLVLNKFPIVLADRFLKGIPASSASIDNSEASTLLTEYLISLGHKNIAYISPPLTGTSAIEERLHGYKVAFSYQGLKLNPNYMLTNLMSSLPASVHHENFKDHIKEDHERIEKFISDHPDVTSFVACEYELALLIYNVLKKLGKNIPEDYSIVCFDFPESDLSSVQFTHIKQNERMLANQSIELLLAQINGDNAPKQLITKYKFITGNTSKKIDI